MNKYPDGKLSDNDEGEIDVKVGDFNGRVIVQFPKPITSIGMNAKQAVDLATMLILRARKVTTEPITVNLGEKK